MPPANHDPSQEEEPLGKAYDARLMRRLLRYLKPYRWLVLVAVLLIILASGLHVVGPWLTKILLDEAIPGRDERLLGILVAAYSLTIVVGFGLDYNEKLRNLPYVGVMRTNGGE